ncbi:MAG: hypothetical protein QMD13_01385 [Candidatus Bathyarchaeia archaeon]|nr:hypothetical protein [Candidatus Bathyarchaeia archaeon]
MGCPYFEKSGICGETKTLPSPSYSLKYCSKGEEHYERYAQFNLKRWKDAAHFDLRKIESGKYLGLRKFGSSQIIRGIIREIIPNVNKCKYCKSLQSHGKRDHNFLDIILVIFSFFY